MSTNNTALALHRELKGKITTALRDNELTPDKLAAYYTPGVAAVSSHLAKHPEDTPQYTWVNNLVAVISDGSAVLGLGNIGPRGALPVMEGKAMLFKKLAGVDAVPIVLDVHDTDSIVTAITAIAPSFGAINLEDIAAPQCFAIEDRLKSTLDIPVMHDDQHATAVVVLAGLLNACRVTGRELATSRIVVSGVGAAGVAVMRLLKLHVSGVKLLAVDSGGIVSNGRGGLNPIKQQLIDDGVIIADQSGDLTAAMRGADIFIGLSKGGLLTAEHIAVMQPRPIIFALANPIPEIMPDVAQAAGAAVVATGRSDFANQINNALVFPGLFRGALDHGVNAITDQHKLAAAQAIAELVERPTAEQIIPSIFDERLVPAVAAVII